MFSAKGDVAKVKHYFRKVMVGNRSRLTEFFINECYLSKQFFVAQLTSLTH